LERKQKTNGAEKGMDSTRESKPNKEETRQKIRLKKGGAIVEEERESQGRKKVR